MVASAGATSGRKAPSGESCAEAGGEVTAGDTARARGETAFGGEREEDAGANAACDMEVGDVGLGTVDGDDVARDGVASRLSRGEEASSDAGGVDEGSPTSALQTAL